jgi:hypothetical protein
MRLVIELEKVKEEDKSLIQTSIENLLARFKVKIRKINWK